MMSVMYGGPSMGPGDGRTTPFNPPIAPYVPPTITTDTVTLCHSVEPQKLTVTACTDKDGNICLLISIDGVQKAEVKGGTTASVTVDL